MPVKNRVRALPLFWKSDPIVGITIAAKINAKDEPNGDVDRNQKRI